jgi:diguanylate cyclase (GGDEF)-like protein
MQDKLGEDQSPVRLKELLDRALGELYNLKIHNKTKERANQEMENQHAALLKITAELEKLAYQDDLTGLGNRRMYERDFPAYFSQRPAALVYVMMDIDNFKAINDGKGHPVGDLVLRELGQSITTVLGCTLKPSEYGAARYGGEEIALALPESIAKTSYTDLIQSIAQDFAKRTLALTDQNGERYFRTPITFSAGAATQAFADDDLSALCAKADIALYVAKGKKESFQKNPEERRTLGRKNAIYDINKGKLMTLFS